VNALILFGHLGLTVGAFKLYKEASSMSRHREKSRLPDIDYRFVLLGFVLPDLIDKPIGALLFINTYHNSRIYAHTLLFSLILIISGAVLRKRRNSNIVLTLGIGSMIHLILDGMWQYPETILWPFFNINAALSAKNGWLGVLLGFPYKFDHWLATSMDHLLRDPSPLIFELAGAVIIAVIFIGLLRKKKLKEFFKTGRL
jgi:inner membrane protein